MSDDTEMNQDDIDSILSGDGEESKSEETGGDDDGSSAMFGAIDESGSPQEQEKEYEIGEPMANDVTAIYDIPVQISAVLGRSNMQVSQLLKLGRGAVVELDRKVGEAIDIYVNNRLVARGEVVVVEDKLGVTMTEIVKSDKN
jgi:flagellar motor switch protein FliN